MAMQAAETAPGSSRGFTGNPDLAAMFLAHDLNNVLQIVAGNLELLELSLGGGGAARRHLRSALKGVELGSALTARALERPGAVPASEQPLGEQLNGFADLIEDAVGPDVELSFRVCAALPAVRARVSDLKNAVLNLAINARDAMDGRGRLEVLFVNCADSGRVLITVRDDGPGIAPELVGRVFDPHFSTKSCARRRGFGLAAVKAFAAETGTTIDLVSGPQGTAVTLRLPVLGVTIDGAAS